MSTAQHCLQIIQIRQWDTFLYLAAQGSLPLATNRWPNSAQCIPLTLCSNEGPNVLGCIANVPELLLGPSQHSPFEMDALRWWSFGEWSRSEE